MISSKTVTITEALKVIRSAPAAGQTFDLAIACGFTPLHLQTFLTAHLQQNLARKVVARTALFGNAAGMLESLAGAQPDAAVLVLEWADLDPRLGFRETGSWDTEAIADAVAGAKQMLNRLCAALSRVPAGVRVGVCLPTLPLPPVFHTSGWYAGPLELELEAGIAAFAESVSRLPGVSVVNMRRLAENSAAASRLDLKSDLLTGLPYALPHADAVAAALANVLAPPPPKKGLITDLDNTLWYGIAGEVGPDGVSWDLASHRQIHGLYQKLLAAMSQQGILIGIASKNDPAVVNQVFGRSDILLSSDRVFPVEVHWGAKSVSVGRILQQWNISADSVVFVDDSPMELGEVAAAHPGIECIHFPAGDDAGAYAVLRHLRDLFGKQRLSDDDAIRLSSIRQASEFRHAAETGSAPENFLEQAEATVTFDYSPSAGDMRILELVNKTNQFNLNGIRFTEGEWHAAIGSPDTFLAAVSYEDKYGKLGKIGVMQGTRHDDVLFLNVWVMSCRAFARRIEHQCLRNLFTRFGAGRIAFAFTATPRNGPLQTFFESIGAGTEPQASITREQFDSTCPPLYHKIKELTKAAEANG